MAPALHNRARMRRAWLLALLALPALGAAQTPPTPTKGNITYATEALTAIDKYINAAECRSGTITLRWAISYDTGKSAADLVSFQLYASDHTTTSAVTTGACPTTNDDKGVIGLHAGSVGDRITGTNLTDPSPALVFDTDVIATVSGLGSCNMADTDVMLCVQARDSVGTIGTARTTLTVSTAAPSAPTNASATPGDQALNVSWSPSQGDPAAEYYIAEARTATGSQTSGAVSAGSGTMSTRIEGLTNGVVYDVFVTAYSTADNPSVPPDFAGTASPEPVNDFWKTYKNAGGREQGGCASGAGAAGALGLLLAAASLVVLRRRK